MASHPGTPRSAWQRILALLLILSVTSAAGCSDASSPTAAAPTTNAVPSTTAPPPPAATAEPTDALLPPGGDERGCPRDPGSTVQRDYDANDPFCGARHNQYAYDHYYANNPAYDCPDGRNRGLGPAELEQFVPCVNGVLRLEVQYGRTWIYATSDKRAKLYTGARSDVPQPAPDLPWVIWQGGIIDDNSAPKHFNLYYWNASELTFFNGYYRQGAGQWRLMIDPGNEQFDPTQTYQVVLFWTDPAKPRTDAPLPPGFTWSEAAKHKP